MNPAEAPPSVAAAAPPPPSVSPAPAVPPAPSRGRRWLRSVLWVAVALALVALGALVLTRWVAYRLGHSVTDDAFVEAHIINVAPEMVSGRIVRFLVDENDSVESGQLLAELDPVPYRDRVSLASAKLDSATEELGRQQADLERLRREVPIHIEIARRSLAAAMADRSKAEESLKLTEDDVERGIDEARAALKAAKADQLLAQQEFSRFTNLYRQEVVAERRSQEVTRSRDAAQAQVDLAEARLAKALASRTQVDVARRSLDAAGTTAQKAEKGIDLAATGNDQVRVVELLVAVKKKAVEEARRALESAEHELAYTQIRAPFSGVVIRRFRHLGDFASVGVALLSMYNPELLYVTANLEETRLPGVAPGAAVRLDVDALREPFRGRVIWINKSTGAQFSLMPRNVVSGEFTKVVQRVPVRIGIERDDPRWAQLRAGLSVRVAFTHGTGDPVWAAQAARRMADLEGRSNPMREPAADAPERSLRDVPRELPR
ncbi:MAG: HlyD family secretion protein [Isosphaeraceae bacterium]|nr:HlyD family secretion protein [Isosphaeraceae bacterium]